MVESRIGISNGTLPPPPPPTHSQVEGWWVWLWLSIRCVVLAVAAERQEERESDISKCERWWMWLWVWMGWCWVCGREQLVVAMWVLWKGGEEKRREEHEKKKKEKRREWGRGFAKGTLTPCCVWGLCYVAAVREGGSAVSDKLGPTRLTPFLRYKAIYKQWLIWHQHPKTLNSTWDTPPDTSPINNNQ